MELSGLKIKNFLIFFLKKTHPENISCTFQKDPKHFSALASKFFPEKIFFFLKQLPWKKCLILSRKNSLHILG